MIKLSKIKPNPKNPRSITEDKFKKLCASIEKFPEMMSLRPMVVDKNMVTLGGNMRLKALKHLGFKEIPDNWIIQADELTEAQKREFIVKDNVGFGDWDWDELANDFDLSELNDWAMDIPDDILGLFEDEKETEDKDEDFVPEPPEIPTAKLGDIYQLGRHRVMCGDSTDKATVEKLMDGKKADMVFTDPPYDFDNFNYSLFDGVKKTFIFGSDKQLVRHCNNINSFRHFFIQKKVPPTMVSSSMPMGGHNIIAFFCSGKVDFINTKDGFQTILGDDCNKSHSTSEKVNMHKQGKPVALPEKFFLHYSKIGDLVVDFFAGAGSTLIACEKTSRLCYGIELDPKNIDVIIARWEEYTGEKAKKLN